MKGLEQDRILCFASSKSNYNVMIDGTNFLDQSVKIELRTYDNIQKLQGNDKDI